MTSPDLTLEEDECTGLRDDVAAELGQQEVDHVNIALVDLRMDRFHVAFGGLRSGLSGAEDVGK
jgi:hypothetical protein